ncbi:helix-turn-helix domain-containing protein [Burkholderia stagnalis]|uniref:helix-turn-helix domain-containing protein n=1 Tax=Burkholderia stagnalis TaxID=1503054 RepID=UPI0039BF9278
MAHIGSRLRDERLRIGLSQDEFATVGGVARRSQSAYESDERAPDAAYLLAVREIGVDIGYVLTGERAAGGGAAEQGARDADEADVLAMYRQLNDAGKASLHAFLTSCINTGAMLQPATPRRAKRLPENRRAALDQRTAENVDRAKAELERLKAERAAKGSGK